MTRTIYNVMNDNLPDLKTDLLEVVDEVLSANEQFAVYPVFINRWLKDGHDSFTEIHSEILYIVSWYGILSFFCSPVAYRLLMNDQYNAQEHVQKSPYIFYKVFENEIELMGTTCTPMGNMLDVASLNNEIAAEITEFMTYNYKHTLDPYIVDMDSLWVSIANYRDLILKTKLDDVGVMMQTGERSLEDNPYEFYMGTNE